MIYKFKQEEILEMVLMGAVHKGIIPAEGKAKVSLIDEDGEKFSVEIEILDGKVEEK